MALTPAQHLLHEAVDVLATHALGRERVDWAAVERELSPALADAALPHMAYPAITSAVARLRDPHARFVTPVTPATTANGPAQTSNEKNDTKSLPQTAQKPARVDTAERRVPVLPEGRHLPGGIGYLVIPGCFAPDIDSLRSYARSLSAEVARLTAGTPKGWIIDLRLNGGGNLWPMLLGLHPLLHEGTLMTMTARGVVLSRFGASQSNAWIDWGNGPESQLDWGSDAPMTIHATGPIAVLLVPWTMSSGESLALCLTRDDNVRTFGEPSAGLTTVTNLYPLSDGSVLNIPVSEMGTAQGIPVHGRLQPNQPVEFGEWPTADDAAATAARRWLEARIGTK